MHREAISEHGDAFQKGARATMRFVCACLANGRIALAVVIAVRLFNAAHAARTGRPSRRRRSTTRPSTFRQRASRPPSPRPLPAGATRATVVCTPAVELKWRDALRSPDRGGYPTRDGARKMAFTPAELRAAEAPWTQGWIQFETGTLPASQRFTPVA